MLLATTLNLVFTFIQYSILFLIIRFTEPRFGWNLTFIAGLFIFVLYMSFGQFIVTRFYKLKR